MCFSLVSLVVVISLALLISLIVVFIMLISLLSCLQERTTGASLVARMRGDARARARREQRAWRARGRGSAEVVGEAVAGPRRGESAARREAESTSVDGRTRVRQRTAATHACSVCVKRALYARARVQGAEQREGAQATQWRPRCAPFVQIPVVHHRPKKAGNAPPFKSSLAEEPLAER